MNPEGDALRGIGAVGLAEFASGEDAGAHHVEVIAADDARGGCGNGFGVWNRAAFDGEILKLQVHEAIGHGAASGDSGAVRTGDCGERGECALVETREILRGRIFRAWEREAHGNHAIGAEAEIGVHERAIALDEKRGACHQ